MYAVMEQDNWEDYDRKKTKTRINVQFNTLARKEWNIIASIHKLYVFVFWFSFIYCLDFCLSVSHCKCLDSLRTGPAVMCPTDFTFTELQRNFLILQKMSVKILRHVLNWVEEQTYWIASRFLMLGFELDLYSPSEYCMVYWYLYVVLIKLAEKTHFRMAVSNEPSKFVSIFICDFTSEIC